MYNFIYLQARSKQYLCSYQLEITRITRTGAGPTNWGILQYTKFQIHPWISHVGHIAGVFEGLPLRVPRPTFNGLLTILRIFLGNAVGSLRPVVWSA